VGIHHGIVAAQCSPADLLGELARHVATLTVGEAVDGPFDVNFASATATGGAGWTLAIGGRDGRAFLLDTSMVLSNSADMLLAMSVRLGTVVGGGAETATGSSWLTVARRGQLDRFVYDSRMAMTRAMAIGEALPCEPVVDADGLFTALASAGLDPRSWLAAGPSYEIGWDGSRFPTDGRIAGLQREHYEQYGLHTAG
jgi:hypothetical protein